MAQFSAFIQSWERTGISAHDSWKERNRIILLNRFFLIFMPVMVVVVIINLALSLWLSTALNVLLLCCILLGQWLTYRREHLQARWSIILLSVLVMNAMICVFGREIGGYMTFMVLGVGGVIMFDSKRARLVLVMLLFCSFFAVETFLQMHGPFVPLVYPQLLYPITFLPNFFAVGLLVWFFGSLQEQHDQRVEAVMMELEKKNAALARSNALLQTYSHTISHHIKSPLKNISNLLEAYSRGEAGKVSAAKANLLALAIRQSSHLARLVQNLLDFSTLDKTGDQSTKVTVSLDAVMEQVRLNLGAWTEEKNAIIDWDSLPSVRMWEGHAELLLQNLVENGLKYNRSERPVVKVSGSQKGEMVTLRIRDNGIGISPEYQIKVFELFSRLHSNEDFEGSGMGLSICHTIVSQAGGRIQLQSLEGHGTEVIISLPQTEAAVVAGPQPVKDAKGQLLEQRS